MRESLACSVVFYDVKTPIFLDRIFTLRFWYFVTDKADNLSQTHVGARGRLSAGVSSYRSQTTNEPAQGRKGTRGQAGAASTPYFA